MSAPAGAPREIVLRLPARPRPSRVVALVALVLTLLALLLREDAARLPAASVESAPVYGRCTGVVQGPIKGDATAKGREGQWSVSTLTHHLARYLDGGAQPLGSMQHEAIVITMPVSRAVPPLLAAMDNGERLSSCVFDLLEQGPSGKAVKYYSIQLSDAYVVDYKLTARSGGADVVQFSFAYGTLTSTFTTGGIQSQLTWPQGGA